MKSCKSNISRTKELYCTIQILARTNLSHLSERKKNAIKYIETRYKIKSSHYGKCLQKRKLIKIFNFQLYSLQGTFYPVINFITNDLKKNNHRFLFAL